MLSEKQIEEMKRLMKMNVKKATADDWQTLPVPSISFDAEDLIEIGRASCRERV